MNVFENIFKSVPTLLTITELDNNVFDPKLTAIDTVLSINVRKV